MNTPKSSVRKIVEIVSALYFNTLGKVTDEYVQSLLIVRHTDVLTSRFTFYSFVKVSLTKNPKKRPAAERMLYHPFVLAGDLNVRLSLDLLQKVRNPEANSAALIMSQYDDDEGMVANVPKRISSKTPRNKQKTQSEINSEFWVEGTLTFYCGTFQIQI